MLPGSGNTQLYKDRFKAMSDKDFDAFITYLRNGGHIQVIVPNKAKVGLSTERNLKVLDEMGVSPFHRIWCQDEDGNEYLTPIEYMVLPQMVRRQEQSLVKKISVAEHNQQVDDYTGQPTGDSSASGISFPQMRMIHAQGGKYVLMEFFKARGGDEKMYRDVERQIALTGQARVTAVEEQGEVKALTTLRTYLKAMHLDTTL